MLDVPVRWQLFLVPLAFLFYAEKLSSQTDDCHLILDIASRNYSQEEFLDVYARSVYKEHCQGVQSSFGFNVDGSAVIPLEGVLANFGATLGTTRERTKKFCKKYKEDIARGTRHIVQQNVVVARSVRDYVECKRLFANGIKVTPHIDERGLDIDFHRVGRAEPVISGVIYSTQELNCTAFDHEEKKRDAVNGDTYLELDGSVWSVHCDRVPEVLNDLKVFPEAQISVDTSEGTFRLSLPEDARLPTQWSSRIRDEVADLKRNLGARELTVGPPASISNWREVRQASSSGIVAATINIDDGPFDNGVNYATIDLLVGKQGALTRVASAGGSHRAHNEWIPRNTLVYPMAAGSYWQVSISHERAAGGVRVQWIPIDLGPIAE